MKPLRLALALLLALAILSCEEEEAMSGTHEQLGWEWPGDRAADIRILVRVDAIDALEQAQIPRAVTTSATRPVGVVSSRCCTMAADR